VSESALAALAASSPYLADRLAALERAAASDAPALVLGEAGTGRSALARALHSGGARAGGPLIEVDPAALPPALIESELFGHRPGAFTGADRVQVGRVGRAEGGTLLLDHVEELPLACQPKLLRLLAERRYAPLGGAETTADVRFVAVGAEDLAGRVERGVFRGDLYWRLEVLTFRLPPLRERRGDVLPAADAMLADLALRFARPGLELSERARRWLPEQDWPGNLRQLRNLLERELLSTRSARLDPSPPRAPTTARPRSLADCEREAILGALAFARGHQGHAAELLGISRKGLWEKRKRLGIP
jgi:two-component system C4-dicarboxylate transport response regulator DctD